jgi:formylglycine-generating enzyme required for sulfatase activity
MLNTAIRYAVALTFILVLGIPPVTRGADGPPNVKPVSAKQLQAIELKYVNFKAWKMSVQDLMKSHPKTYRNGQEYLKKIADYELRFSSIKGNPSQARELLLLRKKSLVFDNPAVDFDELLLVKRKMRDVPHASGKWRTILGLPANYESNSTNISAGWENEIGAFSIRNEKYRTVYVPKDSAFVGDLLLHFDGDRLLFSMPKITNLETAEKTAVSRGEGAVWNVFEVKKDGSGLRQVTRSAGDLIHNYDACYLPCGDIIYTSTACVVGVPCVGGNSHVATLFRCKPDGSGIRQLCFDQDHNWSPRIMHNGVVLYQRWEYTDTPHSNTRLLMTMNPDGTNQREYYGSNSYWPNAVFYARPIPGHNSKVAGIVTGHHGIHRAGELTIFDPALGRTEAQGAVQQIPGYGEKVEAKITDGLQTKKPLMLHPFPLNEKYFLASLKVDGRMWAVALVDIFDNLVVLRQEPNHALFEPIPLKSTKTPPVVTGRVDLSRKDATIFLTNIYVGPGLKGIPPGTVKKLRVSSYTFSYPNVGGLQHGGGYGALGIDGPWDIKRVLGTVPVNSDGSAMFKVPANTPISLQPLDSEGKSLALMRSWMTAMPGEVLSCIGCHEKQNDIVPVRMVAASSQEPSTITPWRDSVYGFSFEREVQPVLDRYCAGCHDGSKKGLPYLRGDKRLTRGTNVYHESTVNPRFLLSYINLFQFIRGPGLESDYHLLSPMEFHADTTELVQMLLKGHHNVKIDSDSWLRLTTWIDMNTPFFGSWFEATGGNKKAVATEGIRAKYRVIYASVNENHEDIPAIQKLDIKPIMPKALPKISNSNVSCSNWPMSAAQAKAKQKGRTSTLDLGNGVTLQLTWIPPGDFVMGSADGHRDEMPRHKASIKRGYWIGKFEVTNQQYALFNSEHDSHYESRNGYQFGHHGYKVNGPKQPAVRISWKEAKAFCAWLSKKTGKRFDLPTEAQWEYACRAGSDRPFNYGGLDFSSHANLSDLRTQEFRRATMGPGAKLDSPLKLSSNFADYIPKDARYNDKGLVSVDVGTYRPNAWGLCDMHGNVAEWTRSLYKPYPYTDADGRDAPGTTGKRVARGGSWRDRPQRSTSSFRIFYRDYQKVFNVGFRVVMED